MVKDQAANAGDLDSIPHWEAAEATEKGGGMDHYGEGNGNPLRYSCLENSMDRGAWWAVVHRIPKSWTQL